MPFQMLAIAMLLMLAAPPRSIRLEAEDGQLVGVTVAKSRPGYSGTGYVTGFQHDGDRIVWHVQAHAGLYTAKVGYSAPSGEKGYDLVVNGSKVSAMLPATGDRFATTTAGRVELKEGLNTVAIEKGWGYYDIDYVEFVPAVIAPTLRKPPKALADPQATARTRALMGRLVDLYGSRTLSGQVGQEDAEFVRQVTGKTPAILGGDFMDYSPSRVAHGGLPRDGTEQMIRMAQTGRVVTMLWHWNAPTDLMDRTYRDAQGKTVEAPWYKGFYTYATTFDVQRALDHPDSEGYRLILRDIDAIAVQLKKLDAADVPVLWRPLHEAEGGWFWWGAKGPGPFVRLWHLLFERLTNHHHLHNLIWIYTGSANADWYPGDAYVDIIGTDAYPSDPGDPLSGTWDALQRRFEGKKLLALTEFGGVPDVAKMRRFGVRWSYFVSWVGDLGPHKMSMENLKRLYSEPDVVNTEFSMR
jgi:mannan endo-1,4-beta-mannosidase